MNMPQLQSTSNGYSNVSTLNKHRIPLSYLLPRQSTIQATYTQAIDSSHSPHSTTPFSVTTLSGLFAELTEESLPHRVFDHTLVHFTPEALLIVRLTSSQQQL